MAKVHGGQEHKTILSLWTVRSSRVWMKCTRHSHKQNRNVDDRNRTETVCFYRHKQYNLLHVCIILYLSNMCLFYCLFSVEFSSYFVFSHCLGSVFGVFLGKFRLFYCIWFAGWMDGWMEGTGHQIGMRKTMFVVFLISLLVLVCVWFWFWVYTVYV